MEQQTYDVLANVIVALNQVHVEKSLDDPERPWRRICTHCSVPAPCPTIKAVHDEISKWSVHQMLRWPPFAA